MEATYDLKPLGCYEYVSGHYTIQEALERLNDAQVTGQPIICLATAYDETSGSLFLNFHGINGIIRKGSITQNSKLRPQDLEEKTTKVRITKVNATQKEFFGERISVEEEAFRQLKLLEKGNFVEGTVKNIINDKACAFVDLKEGYCAYLPLFFVTPLPDTCCRIDEFIRIGERVRLVVKHGVDFSGLRRSVARVGLANFQTLEEVSATVSVGDVREGMLRTDRIQPYTYYLLIDTTICVKIVAMNEVDVSNPIKIRIIRIDYRTNMTFGALADDELSEESFDLFNDMDENGYEDGDKDNTSVIVDETTPPQFGGQGSLFESKVLTPISPFACRDFEEKYFESDLTRFSRSNLESKIKLGHITETHKEVMKAIGTLGYCTSKQIMSYFYSQGVSTENQNKLNKKIESVGKLSLLSSVRFRNDETESLFRVYSLHQYGRWTLRNVYKEDKSYPEYNFFGSIQQIKLKLASNQVALMCMECIPSYKELINHRRPLYAKDTGVSPTAILRFENSALLLEGLRRPNSFNDENSAKKQERYEALFKDYDERCHDQRNPSFLSEVPFYLVFVCEDEQHAREMYDAMSSSALLTRAFFTYDLLMFQGSPLFSIFRFNPDGTIMLYSLLDLVERNAECFTASKMDGLNFSNCEFNSFPEQYLQNMMDRNLTDSIFCENITVQDSHQNMEYLYLNDFDGFLESTAFSRRAETSNIVWEPRVFFLGTGSAGKTSLVKVLAEQNYDKNEKKTDGVQVHLKLWENLSWMNSGDTKISNINVWDFAGQESDHVFSSFLMTQSALYVLVLDARSEDSPDVWLNYIQTYAPRSRVILVINKLDEVRGTVQKTDINMYHRINIAKYSDEYSNIKGVFQTSCEHPNMLGCELNELKTAICEQILLMEEQFKREWPPGGSDQLREWLRTKMETTGYIMVREFNEKHREFGVDSESSHTLKLCARSGLCIYNERMNTYIVLNPQWLTYGISKILKSDAFSETKWKLTKDEIKSILETPEAIDGDRIIEFNYQDETEDFLQILDNLGLCVREDDVYIFPCFLKYPSKRDETDALSDMSGWYERQVTYKFLPPEVFPEFQVRLWAQQWNRIKPSQFFVPSYEADRGRIVFIKNGKKMVALKENNSIILAVERENPDAEVLTNDEKQAIQEAKAELKKLHNDILKRHNIRENDMAKEQIILKGRSRDLTMKRLRYPYEEDNLKKICMSGVAGSYYFPEVDQWYNAAELLLDEYSEDKIKKIYYNYLISVRKVGEQTHEEANNETPLGVGFLMPYIGNWYIITCAHIITNNESKELVFNTTEGYQLNAELIFSIYDRHKLDCDIAAFRVTDTGETLNYTIPKEVLSFRKNNRSDRQKNIYCKGYHLHNNLNDSLVSTNNSSIIDCIPGADPAIGASIHVEAGEGTFSKGFSGAPMIDMDARCIFGMLSGTYGENWGVEEKYVKVIPIEKIWRFLEDAITAETRETANREE